MKYIATYHKLHIHKLEYVEPSQVNDAIQDFFIQTSIQWMGEGQGSSLLELILKQMIGIALKSSQAASYIERLI